MTSDIHAYEPFYAYAPYMVCQDYLLDFYELPPETQHNLEILCDNIKIVGQAYNNALHDNDYESVKHWYQAISKLQSDIKDLLKEYTPIA